MILIPLEVIQSVVWMKVLLINGCSRRNYSENEERVNELLEHITILQI